MMKTLDLIAGYMMLSVGLFISGLAFTCTAFISVTSLITGEPWHLSSDVDDQVHAVLWLGISGFVCCFGVFLTIHLSRRRALFSHSVPNVTARTIIPIVFLIIGVIYGFLCGDDQVGSQKYLRENMSKQSVEHTDDEARGNAPTSVSDCDMCRGLSRRPDSGLKP